MSYDETNLHYIKLIMITTSEHKITAGYARANSDYLSLPGVSLESRKLAGS